MNEKYGTEAKSFRELMEKLNADSRLTARDLLIFLADVFDAIDKESSK